MILSLCDGSHLKLQATSVIMMRSGGLLVLLWLQAARAFYLPDVAPRTIKDGEEIDGEANLKVQTLVSTDIPLQFDCYSDRDTAAVRLLQCSLAIG